MSSTKTTAGSNKSTEENILAAAKEVFVQRGYAGTRMQEVADKAGINKAMLHYYFRSKEKLFRVILSEAMDAVTPMMINNLSTDKPVMEKLKELAEDYLAVLLDNPHMPLFIMHELSQNQGAFVTEHINRKNAPSVIARFFEQVREEGEAGIIRRVDPIHLLMNTMSLIVFPFVARPMISTITGLPDETFRPVLEKRREETIEFLRAALQP